MVRNLLPSLIALKVFHKIKYFMKLSISSNGVKPVAKAESCFAAEIEGVKLVVQLELALDKYESLLCCVAKNLDFYLWETFSDTCSM